MDYSENALESRIFSVKETQDDECVAIVKNANQKIGKAVH